MAAHSTILAWRILWTEGPGGLLSMEPQRVGHSSGTNTTTGLGWARPVHPPEVGRVNAEPLTHQ